MPVRRRREEHHEKPPCDGYGRRTRSRRVSDSDAGGCERDGEHDRELRVRLTSPASLRIRRPGRALEAGRSEWQSGAEVEGAGMEGSSSASPAFSPSSLPRSRAASPSEARDPSSASPRARAFSRVRFQRSLRTQRAQRTTLTSAEWRAPCSSYANGSSSVARPGIGGAPEAGGCSGQRVFAHDASPAPESTSASVRQRSANWRAASD